jgi:SAM-dependent methyltransferase
VRATARTGFFFGADGLSAAAARAPCAPGTSLLTDGRRRFAGAIGRLPLVSKVLRHPPIRHLLETIPGITAFYGSGWDRVHPFDRLHGTDTSGWVSPAELPMENPVRAHAICYAGSQPSVLRRALAALPAVETCTFLDLGCGKGRALLVASEFPFYSILGVELSAPLAQIARHNAGLLRRRFPGRPPIAVVAADASTFPLPRGDLVLFLYHPFSEELVARVACAAERALAAAQRSLYVIYCNPVAGFRFDASPSLRRRFAATLCCTAEERGYGPDESDVVVIWQGGAAPAPTAPAGNSIVVAPGGLRAMLQPA